jgi:sulfite exporter TauE/SafE
MAQPGTAPVKPISKTKTNKKTIMKKILSLLLLCLGLSAYSFAQDSSAAEAKEAPKQKFTRTTFNSSRIINMQSTEIVSKGALEFMISHHFSNIWNKGAGTRILLS